MSEDSPDTAKTTPSPSNAEAGKGTNHPNKTDRVDAPSTNEPEQPPVDQFTKEEIAKLRLLLKKLDQKKPTAEKSNAREKDNIPPWSWRTTKTTRGFGRGFSEKQTEQLTEEEIKYVKFSAAVYGPKSRWLHLGILLIALIIGVVAWFSE